LRSLVADALNVESVRIIRLKDEFMTVEGNQIVLCFVSVEVPNHVRTKVIMRDLFESDEWRNAEVKIPIAFGKDAYGHPIIADLADMPHLFIGGSVGSGKSICIHSIILSLLYRFSPDQLRFVMIDSKGIELQSYNALPHLVAPVIRSEQKASVSLLQRRLHLGYMRAALIMEELENRGIVGPSKGAEPRDILIDLDAGDYTTSIKQPPIIQPHLIVCVCEHCSEKIEFDANELGDRQSVTVSCPHCGVETSLSNPR
jgi:DNA segregation ATPase FtsK/SpoIIIE-like protein